MPTAVFDMLGTFFSLEPLRQRLHAAGAPEVTLQLWFAEAQRDHIARAHAGDYAPYAETLAAALPRTFAELGVKPPPASKLEQILGGLRVLNPAEGAADAVTRLSRAGWRIVALTNAGEDATRALLSRAGLIDRFDAILSADEAGTSKPHPDAYALVHRVADVGMPWMITAHAWDALGAHRSGFRTVWVGRKERVWLGNAPEPELAVPDLSAATDVLLRSTGIGEHALAHP